MGILRDFQGSARAHGAPVTVALVVLLALSFLVGWIAPGLRFQENLAFLTADAAQRPWTLATYPFAASMGDLLSLVFTCLWLWGIGGHVERDIGPSRFLTVWIAFTILCALGLWIGSAVLGTPAFITGAWNPIAAITVIWGVRNAGAQIMLMFVLPITGKWMAWLSAGLVFFGTRPPQLAPFAAVPLFLAYLYAAQKLAFAPYYAVPRSRARGENAAGTRRVFPKGYYDDVKRREQAREEKERLRRLFERSMVDDPDEKPDR